MFRWLDADHSSGKGIEAKNARHYADGNYEQHPNYEADRFIPFLFLHAGCLAVPLVGVSNTAVVTAVVLYLVRMFAITGFYHRYFSHRSFKTSRIVQFIFAAIGTASVQRGPLWWAAHHRHHHKHSDEAIDIHSPRRSFIWSHIGWLTASSNMKTRYELIPDFARFPELMFLNRFDWCVPTLLFIGLYACGELLRLKHPDLHTSGWQLVVWGFFISTCVLFHATSAINSLAHIFGSRRYETPDDSKNNPFLAVVTLGEGWHNNHHKFSFTTRQGFYWWELDLTYYALVLMSWLGLVSDLRPVPEAAYRQNTKEQGSTANPERGLSSIDA